MLRTAVMPSWQVYVFPPEWIPEEIHLEYFRQPFATWPFAAWLLNTVLVATVATIGTLGSSSIVGFSFARLRTPGRNALFMIVLATMMLPYQVRLIPTYVLFVKLGWVNTYLPLLVPRYLAPAFYVFLFRQFFMTIPQEMDDAAVIDGCDPFGLFVRLHLPMSVPVLGVAAIMQFRHMWNEFMEPLIYVQNVDNFLISQGLRLFSSRLQIDMQGLMAASTISIVPLIILFFIAQRYYIEGIVVSGVKG